MLRRLRTANPGTGLERMRKAVQAALLRTACPEPCTQLDWVSIQEPVLDLIQGCLTSIVVLRPGYQYIHDVSTIEFTKSNLAPPLPQPG